jgi:perosamine synthetase
MKKIMVAQPSLTGNEKKYVNDCLESTWISSHGKYINKFEETFSDYIGVKNSIATNNGTTALHLALVGLGLKTGDEVIVPTVTYIATANAVKYCGATPVFVDVKQETMNINPNLIEEKISNRTRGIIPVHLYGHPADMVSINRVAKKHNLWVLEDAAEAHGAEVLGAKVGRLGTCATFSFFGNKIITTGEGGMITTNDDNLAEKLRILRGQGMDPNRRYWFQIIGYNYRMTNIQAAIGLAQMEAIERALSDRKRLAGWYNESLRDLSTIISLPIEAPWAKHVYWMYTIYLRDGGEKNRDTIMQTLDEMGIETRPVFYPLHTLPPYQEDNAYPVSDLWAQRGINLPTHRFLTRKDVSFIAESLQKAIDTL